MLIRNTCSQRKIEPQYRPIIGAAIETYQSLFGSDLLDIRLLGSVARGQAIPGESDIDFLALLQRAPRPSAIEELANREELLRTAYPVVARVDLEAECLDQLTEFRRFVVSSDSLSLFGADHLTRRQQRLDRAELARLVTPDAHQLICGYRAAVEALDLHSRDQLARYARVIGKDLLRCLRQIALLRGGAYETSSTAIYEQVVALVPEHRPLAEALHALIRAPGTTRDGLLRVLDLSANLIGPGAVLRSRSARMQRARATP